MRGSATVNVTLVVSFDTNNRDTYTERNLPEAVRNLQSIHTSAAVSQVKEKIADAARAIVAHRMHDTNVKVITVVDITLSNLDA